MNTTNQIIENIPNCSLITDEDEALYNEFFKTEGKQYNCHYSRSWIFIKQISNGKGIKYFDKQKEHLLTIAPNWGGEVPNFIFLPLGIKSIESVPPVAEALSKLLNEQIKIKKIYGEENRDYLLKHGFAEVPTTGNTDFKNLDDDKYPEVICDVNSILQASFGLLTKIKMESFKRHIKKIQKNIYFEGYELEEKNLSKKLEKPFKELVDKWSGDIAERTAKQFKTGANPKEIKQWMASVYFPHFIEEYADRVDNKTIISYLTFLNEKAVGFTSAYPINNSCLAVNASFCDVQYEGLIQYLFFRLAARAKLLGYQYLNLGSNDIEAQYRYKASMGKIKEIYPYILQYQS